MKNTIQFWNTGWRQNILMVLAGAVSLAALIWITIGLFTPFIQPGADSDWAGSPQVVGVQGLTDFPWPWVSIGFFILYLLVGIFTSNKRWGHLRFRLNRDFNFLVFLFGLIALGLLIYAASTGYALDGTEEAYKFDVSVPYQLILGAMVMQFWNVFANYRFQSRIAAGTAPAEN